EGGVVAVGESKLVRGQAVADRAQHAVLAEPRVPGEERALSLVGGFAETVDDLLLGRREPEVFVVDVFVERCAGEAEERDVGDESHGLSPFLRSVRTGLKVVRLRAGFCAAGAGRGRLALWTGRPCAGVGACPRSRRRAARRA